MIQAPLLAVGPAARVSSLPGCGACKPFTHHAGGRVPMVALFQASLHSVRLGLPNFVLLIISVTRLSTGYATRLF